MAPREKVLVDVVLEGSDDLAEQTRDEEIASAFEEHKEIAVSGNLAVLADRLGMDGAGDIHRQTLGEERAALDELARFADEYDCNRVTERQAAD